MGKRSGAAGTRDELRDEPVRKRRKLHVDCELTLSGEQDGGPDGSPVNRRKKGALLLSGREKYRVCCYVADRCHVIVSIQFAYIVAGKLHLREG